MEAALEPRGRARAELREIRRGLSVLLPYLLQIAALHLVGNEVPGARRERHDGQPRILERGRGERCGVGQEYILGVPTLIESIQDGRFRIVAHAGATALVDGRPR